MTSSSNPLASIRAVVLTWPETVLCPEFTKEFALLQEGRDDEIPKVTEGETCPLCDGDQIIPNARRAKVLALVEVPCEHRRRETITLATYQCWECKATWRKNVDMPPNTGIPLDLDGALAQFPEPAREGHKLDHYRQVAEAAGWRLETGKDDDGYEATVFGGDGDGEVLEIAWAATETEAAEGALLAAFGAQEEAS